MTRTDSLNNETPTGTPAGKLLSLKCGNRPHMMKEAPGNV